MKFFFRHSKIEPNMENLLKLYKVFVNGSKEYYCFYFKSNLNKSGLQDEINQFHATGLFL